MKRIAACLCAAFLLMTSLFLPAHSASGPARLSLSAPERVSLGEEFQIDLTITPSGGAALGAWLISLSYDPSSMTYLSGADAEKNGTLLFCDAPAQPAGELNFTLRFCARGSHISLRFDKVQLVDFDTSTPLSVEADDLWIPVLIDPEGRGDLDGDGWTDSGDAIYLLFHTLFSEGYPLAKEADFDRSGATDSDDAVYLLLFTLFPLGYPI